MDASAWTSWAGLALALAAALGLYLASPHCLWRQASGHGRRLLRLLALALLIASWLLWHQALGAVTGTCATLAALMLGMLTLPWLAAATRPQALDRGRRS